MENIGNLKLKDADRYDLHSANAALLNLTYYAPLPVLFKEIYGNRRIVIYITPQTSREFESTVNSFLFYSSEMLFVSDKKFTILREECYVAASDIHTFTFKERDLFFALDTNVSQEVIELLGKKAARGMLIECLRKPFIGALLHYVKKIRPLKNLLARKQNLQILLTDNFQAPRSNLTEWEQFLVDNDLTREKMIAQRKLQIKGEGILVGIGNQHYPDEYSTEDILSMHEIPPRSVDEKGVYRFGYYQSEFVNIEGGRRRTIGQPVNFDRTLHVFGGCGLYGIGVPDKCTFASRLQELFNAHSVAIKVENHANFLWGQHDAMWYIVNSVNFNDNDILLIPFNSAWAKYFYNSVPNIHYVDMTVRTPEDGEVFNDMWHPNINGIYLYAKNIFRFLSENSFFANSNYDNSGFAAITPIKQYGIPRFADSTNKVAVQENLLSDKNMEKLNVYLNKITCYKQKIGAIVMNCNPFTLGHRYLIEYAANQVLHLYVFVVEEDKSYFPFADRFKLVKAGVADLPNVSVLPSDKFMISTLTFNDYFGKAQLQDKKVDADIDIEIFGRYIAPTIGITVRFAGAEPLDNVTKQYNETMARILPKYHIDFVEIPRKEFGGDVISASRVRKYLDSKDFEEISKLVPKTTYDYLVSNFGS